MFATAIKLITPTVAIPIEPAESPPPKSKRMVAACSSTSGSSCAYYCAISCQEDASYQLWDCAAPNSDFKQHDVYPTLSLAYATLPNIRWIRRNPGNARNTRNISNHSATGGSTVRSRNNRSSGWLILLWVYNHCRSGDASK